MFGGDKLKRLNIRHIGIALFILFAIEAITFYILKNIVFKYLSDVVELWTMLIPMITTITCAVWCITEAFRSKRPGLTRVLRILITWLWICVMIIGILSLFYPPQ